MGISEIFEVTKHVLSERKYLRIFILSTVLVSVACAFLMTFISLPGLLYGEILVAPEIALRNAVFFVAFSLLMSLAITLHIYKFNESKKFSVGKENIGFLGGFFGLFTSGCAVCYPLILTALGIPTALALLPFGGLELQLLSIALLFLSIYFVSRSIIKGNLCKIKS